MCEADLTGSREVSPAHKTCIGDCMVGGAELAFYDKRAVIEHPGYAENLGRLQGLIEAERRQDPGEPLGEHSLAGPRRTDHENVVRTGRCDVEAPFRVLLALDVFEIRLIANPGIPYSLSRLLCGSSCSPPHNPSPCHLYRTRMLLRYCDSPPCCRVRMRA